MTGELGVLLLGSTPEHGLSAKAVEIGSVFGFPVTNSMVVSWVVALGLIAFARLATRRMDQVPSGAQNFCGWLSGSDLHLVQFGVFSAYLCVPLRLCGKCIDKKQ